MDQGEKEAIARAAVALFAGRELGLGCPGATIVARSIMSLIEEVESDAVERHTSGCPACYARFHRIANLMEGAFAGAARARTQLRVPVTPTQALLATCN